jgi:hypothetical protein
VESSQVINTEDKAKEPKYADGELKDFAQNVVKINLDLVKRYKDA